MPTPSSTKTTFMAAEKTTVLEFDAIKLRLASPEDIHDWSHGEVLKPETINYRTQKPEKDGLFCEKIFGPTKDWECYCGKYKRIRYKGIVCDKCGVEVTRAVVRRERMGHIDLAAPVSHIWFLRGIPSKIGLVLDLSIQNLEKVIYFASFIVTSVDDPARQETMEQIKTELKNKRKQIDNEFNQRTQEINKRRDKMVADGQTKDKAEKQIEQELMALNVAKIDKIKTLEEAADIALKELRELKELLIISETKYQELSLRYGHVFEASIGAEAIRNLLSKINLQELSDNLEEEMETAIPSKQKKLIRRSRLIKSLIVNDINPEWMIMTAVPVIPPDLRPMVQLDGGRFASSDLNDLYRRVINRNNRLKRLKDLNAPEVIQRNEKRMLQEAVDALIDNNARHGKTVTASTGQKRTLKSIADMLKGKQGRFRQNLLGKRVDYSGRSVIVIGPHLKLNQCGLPKTMALELFRPFVISRLIKDELVHNVRSANRYIEAGYPEVWAILEEIVKGAHVMLNRAPTLHRLGIQAFQPVLIEGKAIHLHPLVCSAFNADFDGDQMAVHVPLTEESKKEAAEIMLSSHNLLKPATGEPVAVPSQDMVWGGYYMTYIKEDAKATKAFTDEDEAEKAFSIGIIGLQDLIKVRIARADNRLLETSIGRILFNKILPAKMPYVNELLDKKGLKNIIADSFRLFSREETVQLMDDIKNISFKYITASGLSWGMDDIPTLGAKQDLIKEAEKSIEEIKGQYNNGLLTNKERYVKVIEVWTDIKNRITERSQAILDPTSPIASIINSGARGSMSQMIQIMGMKGLVINPAGEIIELPVKANFKEGLDVLEYFISTHGTRKGLSDTALRTASAGYLTRRLVDVSQDMVVLENDCKDEEGLILTKEESDKVNEPLFGRVVGRVLAEGIKDKKGKIAVKKGTLITKEISEQIKDVDPEQIRIRSVLTCKAIRGVCQRCYGYDLGHNKLVDLGAAVGVVAAQSIGEPGTQLTMRTFHTGGVAEGDITQGLPRVEELFEARQPKKTAILAPVAGIVSIDDDNKLISKDQRIVKIKPQGSRVETYDLNKKMDIKIEDGKEIEADQVLFVEGDKEVRTKLNGLVKLTNKELKVVSQESEIQEVIIPAGYNLWIKDKDIVVEGQQMTEGSIELHELFTLQGKLAVQEYIIKEIKNIYSSQGQNLNDKHVELIVKQMFSRLSIKDVGDADLLPGEIATATQFNEANAKVKAKGKKATGEVLLLGITKAALTSDSFLSASSFQETARVLIDAAITGRVDHLRGLKENVIIGRKIPAGTGFKQK